MFRAGCAPARLGLETRGRGVVFNPLWKSGPVNHFMHPCAGMEGVPPNRLEAGA
ncbi:MAG: hypothetical protein ACOZEN_06490 [Thermodesulfobacteriota bacterium]